MKKGETKYFDKMQWEIYNRKLKRPIVQAPVRFMLEEYLGKKDANLIIRKIK